MTVFRIGEAAELLGVSSDTVRRWVDGGRLTATRDEHGHRVIDGAELAGFVQAHANDPEIRPGGSSARNRLRGIVTAVVKDSVMAQVDIQAGPFRVVSLMSREAADELDLQVGSVAVAVIKSTNVVVERPTPAGSNRVTVRPEQGRATARHKLSRVTVRQDVPQADTPQALPRRANQQRVSKSKPRREHSAVSRTRAREAART